ncbi:nitrile hydratase accessory protein [Paraburkholderia bengalensis]|uniref:Nitrile hydratase accessory protein n=1 Tax=Paraburkholderia bengalensis TaxID=2747562 RepID=A0ABU8J3M2_9BURK
MLNAVDLHYKCIPFTEADDVIFDEPWEARAFALVLQLSKSGFFSWGEWVEFFSAEVRRAEELEKAGQDFPRYYDQWLAALEKIVVAKKLTSSGQLFAKQFVTSQVVSSLGAASSMDAAGSQR